MGDCADAVSPDRRPRRVGDKSSANKFVVNFVDDSGYGYRKDQIDEIHDEFVVDLSNCKKIVKFDPCGTRAPGSPAGTLSATLPQRRNHTAAGLGHGYRKDQIDDFRQFDGHLSAVKPISGASRNPRMEPHFYRSRILSVEMRLPSRISARLACRL